MRIAFLLLDVGRWTDVERAVVAQAGRLSGRHDVEVLSILGAGDADAPVGLVPVRYLAPAGDEAAALAARASVLVPPHWDPDLNALCDAAVEAHLPRLEADVLITTTPGLLAMAAQLLPNGTALVHQEHRSSMHREDDLEPLVAFAPRADAVTTLTEDNAAWLRERLGDRAPLVRAIPNAAPAPGQPRSLLDQPLVVSAGPLDADRQHNHLVRAFGAIADDLPGWRLRIYGSGPRRRSLRRLGQRFGLYDRLELPGASADMPAEWATAGIAAFSSRREGFPLAALDACAAGVPVVAYDCPTGPSEIVEHGINGLLVPQDDDTALAESLLVLARDGDLRQRLGEAARTSLRRYDATAITHEWQELLSGVVADRATGRLTQEAPASGTTAPTARPVDVGLTPAAARQQLLGSTVAALGDLDGWFALPARRDAPPTVVVPSELRKATLAALAEAPWPPWACVGVTDTDHWLPRRGGVPDTCRSLAGQMPVGFTVEPWVEYDGRATHLSRGAGIRVEFWQRDRHGSLRAPRPNSFADVVRPGDIGTGTVEGVAAPALPELAGPFADECRFPVDAVYTWVDDSDPSWRESMARALDPGASAPSATGAARFRNRDELRYSLRSLHAHAPWIRRIYVVTAGQRPPWLADHPRVAVVDHSEILPADALPTFNSHAIETGLHLIPGLSEHFLYLNDDFFLGQPVTPEDFFTPGGAFGVFASAGPIGIGGVDDRAYAGAASTNRRLLRERFGVTITQHLMHVPYPHRRTVLEAVVDAFADDVRRTSRSRFRSTEDVSLVSSLAQHYGLITGSAYLADVGSRFVDTSRPNVEPLLRTLLHDRDVATFCIADHHDYALAEDDVSRLLADFFAEYFPVRPPWETAD